MHELLEDLAANGLSAVPASLFDDLAAWCRDWCIATGDARFCVIADVLSEIFEAFGEQGLPMKVVEKIDGLLVRELPHVLRAESPSSGSQQANGLLSEMRRLPFHPSEWTVLEGVERRPRG